MIERHGWWFPDGETHIPDWMTQVNRRVSGRLTYQYNKYELALSYCRDRRCAIDAGAHVGTWSYWMARDFSVLHAFEPMLAHRECWERNVSARVGVHLHSNALGAVTETVTFATSWGSSGNAHISVDGDLPAIVEPLDSFGLDHVDLLKIDCEGYDAHVVTGARETIARCRPVIVVEQKIGGAQSRYGLSDQAAIEQLEAMGAGCIKRLGCDMIMCFPERE